MSIKIKVTLSCVITLISLFILGVTSWSCFGKRCSAQSIIDKLLSPPISWILAVLILILVYFIFNTFSSWYPKVERVLRNRPSKPGAK